MKEFEIEEIYIYPVKSLSGIRLDKAVANEEGFEYDRKWMLVDKSGSFISQRTHPKLAQFQCELTDSHLIIRYDHSHIKMALTPATSKYQDVSVWDSTLEGQEVNPEIAEWFSDLLCDSVSLVFHGQKSIRLKRFDKPPYQTRVSFADGYPYLLLGTASMELLNSKLEEPIHLNRFRPNLVIRTELPHEEDMWESIYANEVHFNNIKPCARCIMTTVDQETGEMGKEPLKTLATYRQKSNNIYFGTNLIALNTGIIRQGDFLKLSE